MIILNMGEYFNKVKAWEYLNKSENIGNIQVVEK